jgi:hypothetical protein
MTTEAKRHPLQKFDAREIHRSLIKEAPYNPRDIEESNEKRLFNNLENKGLLDTLVWNEQTGNLVSGHRRLKKLDKYAMRHQKSLDYTLTVAVVSLSLKEEIEQNIFFNNQKAQGFFDDDKMLDIFKGTSLPKIDFEDAGFDLDDIKLFGIEEDLTNNPVGNVDSLIEEFEAIKQDKKDNVSDEEYAQRKAQVKAIKQNTTKNEIDTYVTITFTNQKDKQAFMQLIGEQPEMTFIKGEPFVEKYFKQ